MHRKGDISVLQLIVLIEIVLSLVAGGIMYAVMANAADSSDFWARYQAKDLGTLASLAHAAGDEFSLAYESQRPDLDMAYRIDTTGVSVAALRKGSFQTAKTHTYVVPAHKNYLFSPAELYDPILVPLSKHGSIITFETYGASPSPPSQNTPLPTRFQQYLQNKQVSIIILDPGHGLYKHSQGDLRYQRDYYALKDREVKTVSGRGENIGTLGPEWLVEDEIVIDIAANIAKALKAANHKLTIYSTRQLDKNIKSSIQGLPPPLNEEWRLGAQLYLNSGPFTPDITHIDQAPSEGSTRAKDINIRAEYANHIQAQNPGAGIIYISIHTNGGTIDSSGVLLFHSDPLQGGGYLNWRDDRALCEALAPELLQATQKAGMQAQQDAILSDMQPQGASFNWQKYTRMPACTLEIGYHNSEHDNPLLADSLFRETVGVTIARAFTTCAERPDCPFTMRT
ncbi:MAG: N-acetylmuramoyl-L-alanine amidase [Nitrosarchaeum sp.]|nr:N-acetylmuramoyl-L-alanine amidase [Nitrosarchaeum sp.]